MATPTNLFMNWVNVVVTPQDSAAIAIDEITDLDIKENTKVETFYGDNRRYPKTVRPTEHAIKVTIKGGNLQKLSAVPTDVPCVITATLCDSVNGAGTGALNHTIVNAYRTDLNKTGSNNKFAVGDLEFMCGSGVDGEGNEAHPVKVEAVG